MLLLLLPLTREAIRLPRVSHPDAEALAEMGWGHGLRAWEGLRLGSTAGALLVAAASGAPLALVLVAPVLPSLWIRARAGAARERARRARTRIVLATEAALRSGSSLPESLRRAVAASDDALASRPFREAVAAFDLGAPLDLSLRQAAGRCRDRRSALALETLAVGLGERLPRERIADLVGNVADRLVFEERLDDEVRARAGGVRAQVRLLAALVPALALYLSITMPGLAATLDGPLGRTVLLPAAAALEIAGIVLSTRIVREALR